MKMTKKRYWIGYNLIALLCSMIALFWFVSHTPDEVTTRAVVIMGIIFVASAICLGLGLRQLIDIP